MPSIFLAHSSKDKRFARRLAQTLRERGFRVWLDEAELLVADSVNDKIRKAIMKMDFLGAILSPNAVQSRWVRQELKLGRDQEIRVQKIKVIPILFKDCKVPPFLRERLWADFTKRGWFQRGVESLARRLTLKSGLGIDLGDYEPWTPKAVRLGLRFGVLEPTSGGVAFTTKFLQAIAPRALERPPFSFEEFRNNFLLAILDSTSVKIHEVDLQEFGKEAMPHVVEYLVNLAIRSQIIKLEGGGLVINKSMNLEFADQFAREAPGNLGEFRKAALLFFQEMVRSRLMLFCPEHSGVWPMVAHIAFVVFDHGKMLKALWEGALKPSTRPRRRARSGSHRSRWSLPSR